jgi:large subunit ribosomal protein L6
VIPQGIKIDIKNNSITVEGPKGKMHQDVKPEISVKVENNLLKLERKNDEKQVKALHGLYRALLNNMVTGVSKGFERKLIINGVGYRAEVKGKQLVLNLGYSNPVNYDIPDGIKIAVEANTKVSVSGASKEQVGQVCAEIRFLRPPEPYKGKGIKYEEETIIRNIVKFGIKLGYVNMRNMIDKIRKRYRRKIRIRKRVSGTGERPRISIFKSNKYVYLQVIDDTAQHTLVSASNLEKDNKNIKSKVSEIVKLGEILGQRLKDKNITKAVFDRNGYMYHGIIKAVADGIRKSGIDV